MMGFPEQERDTGMETPTQVLYDQDLQEPEKGPERPPGMQPFQSEHQPHCAVTFCTYFHLKGGWFHKKKRTRASEVAVWRQQREKKKKSREGRSKKRGPQRVPCTQSK